MRKIAAIFIALIVLLIAGGTYFINKKLPALATDYAENILHLAGFEGLEVPTGDVRFTAARFLDVHLDPEGFSKIRRIEIRYNPALLFLLGSVKDIEIEGINLTGDLSETGMLGITGWTKPPSLPELGSLKFKTLNVEKSSLAILTREIGGITFGLDFQIRRRGDNADLLGNIKSSQKHLTFVAGATGSLSEKGFWEGTLEIEQGKFDLGPMKATRVIGTIKTAIGPGSPLMLSSELQAGGLTLYKFPWQNASIAIEKQDTGGFHILSDMKAVGVEDLELSLSIENTGAIPEISGTLHTERLSALLEYLQASGIAGFTEKNIASLQSLTGLTVDFTLNQPSENTPQSIMFNIKNPSENTGIKGQIDLGKDGEYTGTLAADPLFLGAFETLLTGAESGQSRFTGGQVTVAGDFARKEDKLSGSVKTELTDGVFDLGGLQLEKIKGALTVSDLTGLSSSKAYPFSCALPLATGISQSCNISIDLTDGQITAKLLDIGIFGGQITARNFEPFSDAYSLTLEVNNIDLYTLTRAMKIENFTGTGAVSGTLPLKIANGVVTVEKGKLRNSGSGILRYTYKTPPDFFEGNALEQEAMRLALENYHYDSFEIGINGPLTGETDISISSHGQNPDLPGQKPLSLNMKTKAALAPLFKNIVKPDQG